VLEPNDRHHLFESLRPPEGYELDCAIGTTFSLDLLTLLTVPLAFTLFEWEDRDGRPIADPLAILEALRRYSDRISIFCQAGQISVPRRSQLLYAHLENSTFEVTVSNSQGVFHPKVWVLRFTAQDGPVLYRVLCLSRNLTFDNSWDTVLVLDGELTDREKAFAANHPLGDFVAALPGLAIRKLPDAVLANIERVQHEIRRTRFDPPEGFESIGFWAPGVRQADGWPFDSRVDRLLVVSPFVSEGCLTDLTGQGSGNVLVSRLESLQGVSQECLKGFEQVYFLSPQAAGEEGDSDDPPVEGDVPIAGLHAKLYIVEEGWDARVLTGSANATDAAFHHNVEFLVEMVGKKSRVGLNVFLSQEKGRTSFADLLQAYTPSEAPTPIDPEAERLQGLADGARRELANGRLLATVSPSDKPDTFNLRLSIQGDGSLTLPPEVTARCWPITLHEAAGVPLRTEPGPIAEFQGISFEALTSFFAFEVTASTGHRSVTSRFVLNLPLQGAPQDRKDRILQSLLSDRNQVLRFILLLLAEGGQDAADLVSEAGQSLVNGSKDKTGSTMAPSVLEPMLKALAHDPTRLDQIARLVEDLGKTPEGKALLPEGFDSIWQPIWSARQRLQSNAERHPSS
jgi:hypothetical protein